MVNTAGQIGQKSLDLRRNHFARMASQTNPAQLFLWFAVVVISVILQTCKINHVGFSMLTQIDKYHLAMPGEYFVAAQLQRLGVSASVTYGNAKSANVVAYGEKVGVVNVSRKLLVA